MFVAVDRYDIAVTSPHELEIEAKREAVQIIGGLEFEDVMNMNDEQVAQAARDLGGFRVRVARQGE